MGIRSNTALMIAALMFVLISCKPKPQIFENTKTVKESTTTTVETLNRDTTIVINRDTAIVVNKVICDSNNIAQMPRVIVKGNTQAKQDVFVVDGILTAISSCDSLAREVEIRDKTIKELKQIEINKESIQPIITNKVPMIVQVLAFIGAVALIVLIIGFTLKISK